MKNTLPNLLRNNLSDFIDRHYLQIKLENKVKKNTNISFLDYLFFYICRILKKKLKINIL